MAKNGFKANYHGYVIRKIGIKYAVTYVVEVSAFYM